MDRQKRTKKIKRTLFMLGVLTSSVFMAPSSSAFAQNLFGSLEFKASSLKGLPKWTGVLSRSYKQEKAFKACDKNLNSCQPKSLAHFRTFMKNHKKSAKNLKLLQELNTFANAWQYVNDMDNYGVSDYWATPLEFLDRSGDCEDYVILKFLALKELGFDPEDLRLVVVKDTVRGIAHAVLAVYLKKEDGTEKKVYILDSLFDRVLEHTQVLQYEPYYSVTEKVRYAHVMPYKKAPQAARIGQVEKTPVKQTVTKEIKKEEKKPVAKPQPLKETPAEKLTVEEKATPVSAPVPTVVSVEKESVEDVVANVETVAANRVDLPTEKLEIEVSATAVTSASVDVVSSTVAAPVVESVAQEISAMEVFSTSSTSEVSAVKVEEANLLPENKDLEQKEPLNQEMLSEEKAQLPKLPEQKEGQDNAKN